MSGWWIAPGNGQVCVDDCVMQPIDMSSIDPNIYIVRWWATNGEILYNHDTSLPIRTKFTDLTPYIQLFNLWMAAAENSPPDPSPPITVPQARTVKSEMVDALFASKRQLPVDYLGYTWDGSDNATTAMSDEMTATTGGTTDSTNSAISALADSTNAAFASLTGDANNSIGTLKDGTNAAIASTAASVDSSTSTIATSLNQQLSDGIDALLSSLGGGTTNVLTEHQGAINALLGGGSAPGVSPGGAASFPKPVTGGTHTDPGTTSAPPINLPTVSTTPISGPDITWPPIGPVDANGVPPAPVTLTFTQFNTLFKMLTDRRGPLQLQRQTHKNNVARLTTVDAIVAYDITSGW